LDRRHDAQERGAALCPRAHEDLHPARRCWRRDEIRAIAVCSDLGDRTRIAAFAWIGADPDQADDAPIAGATPAARTRR
jgi:hypothetical protein